MALIDAQKFYRDLEKGQTAPLYFLFGEEPYLLNQSVERFKYSVLTEGAVDFNYSLFYASDADVVSVRDAVETLPMMAQRRLVILKEAQELTDKEWAELEALFESPVDSTVFVILASRVDKRKKQIRLLLDKADCVEFKKPYENQIPSWINYIAQSLGLTISNDAILLLHKLVGHHLTEIEGELKKLGEFVGERRIEVADVAQAVSRSKEENVFDFTKAIGENDRVKALELLVHLLDQGQNEIGIVSLVARHVRILLTLKRGMEEGLHGAKLAHFAQVPPYFLESYLDQARLWTAKKLEQTLVVLSETDKALKSSPLSSHIWLENLVLKTCGTQYAM
ncbi:DNA polymerase III subunit delta [Bdellovibrio bacteriovorus]|uniref:DNA polymerase III subunit delta n=1 Tax=Bdellovibrio bacteriovorus str. Tiberius TaxID=1069642 RepID=K7YWQ6_BDEBC|nr:DNA polymerase III subunit delta [Bdellovibrio bacteriovorus]AFY01155.1 DNA polymerase III, delta subunit [Bdellovibrio bacteriovorus str. Tiberius]